MALKIDCHGESHMGRKRPANEDQFMIADLNKSMRVHQTSLGLNHQTRLFGGSQGKLMLVADGVGGHESGERASTLAVDGITNYVLNTMDWFFRLPPDNRAEFESELIEAFRHSQQKLIEEAQAIPQRRGMATTLTMAYIDWPNLYVVHVGDTRCYHIADHEIKQLTKDHTMAQVLADANLSDPDTSISQDLHRETHQGNTKMSNVLWNVVGGSDGVLEPQLTTATLAKGDQLLLCSDGLTRYVSNDELLLELDNDRSAKDVCQRLIELANDRGGSDNITAIVAKFIEAIPNDVQVAHVEADTVDLVSSSKPPVSDDQSCVIR